ncbi:MAG: hypothetical protein AAF387_18095 [Pseudomonadota bacterium]
MPEFLYGLGDGSALSVADNFNTTSDSPQRIENVDVFYSLFEVSMNEALALIPTALHPSIPAVIGVTFWHAKESPLGAFNLAFAALACRTGIKPRHLVLKAYTDSESAGDFFGARYGFNCEMAEVFFQENYDRFYGRVTSGGKIVLESETSEALPLVGGGVAVKYSPPLNATRVGDKNALVQFEAGYEFKRAARGKPSLKVFDGPIQAKSPVSGTHALCDIEFMPARFTVDIALPAEEGGAQKIPR